MYRAREEVSGNMKEREESVKGGGGSERENDMLYPNAQGREMEERGVYERIRKEVETREREREKSRKMTR